MQNSQEDICLRHFLDIEGAFDNVSFKAISDAINSSPVDKSTAGWIIKYRHLTVTHKDTTKRIRIRRGCPQGGILSPKNDCCSHDMQESSRTYVGSLSQDVQVDLHNSGQTHIGWYAQTIATIVTVVTIVTIVTSIDFFL